jgi:hypothetical protein
LVFYKDKKLKCNKEEYVNCCSRKETAGIAWGRVGISKLRGIRRGFIKGSWPLGYELKDNKHVLLIRTETRKWKEEFLCKTWMGLDHDLAFTKTIGC